MSQDLKKDTLEKSRPESGGQSEDETVAVVQEGSVLNASGYKDQLKRQYGLVGLAGIALTVDNAWIALGSSISVSIGMPNSLSLYLLLNFTMTSLIFFRHGFMITDN